MENWEFLLQKEGDRAWKALRTPKIEIEEGRYRVVVHTSRINTDVEIRISHQTTDEVPPKRRFQKRSRRTNAQGLMVVIPFTQLNTGIWEIICTGDLMSDMLGDTWQKAVQLRILPAAVTAQPEEALTTATTTETDLAEIAASISTSSYVDVSASEVEVTTPAVTQVFEPSVISSSTNDLSLGFTHQTEEAETENDSDQNESTTHNINELPLLVSEELNTDTPQPQPVLENKQDEVEAIAKPVIKLPSFTVVQTPVISSSSNDISLGLTGGQENAGTWGDFNHDESTEYQIKEESISDEEESAPVSDSLSAEENLPQTDAPNLTDVEEIKERSLQMAEQILQQILDPVWQDFTPPVAPNTESPVATAPEAEINTEDEEKEESSPNASNVAPSAENHQPSPVNANLNPFLLTLDQNAFVARHGEPLTITGRVDVTHLMGLSRIEHRYNINSLYKGSLGICLRDPQNSQVLLKIEQPLPNEIPPFTFSCTFDLPTNFTTRLILGQMVLYDGTITAIASQPFSVTADLQDLLNVITQTPDAIPAVTGVLTAEVEEKPEEQLEPVLETYEPEDETEIEIVSRPMIDLISTPKTPQLINFQPAPNQPLPPKIYQPTPTAKTFKSPQLPLFLKSQPVNQTEEIPAPIEGLEDEQGTPNKEVVPYSEELFLDLFDEPLLKIDATPKPVPQIEQEVLPVISDLANLPENSPAESEFTPQYSLPLELPAVLSPEIVPAVNSESTLIPDSLEFLEPEIEQPTIEELIKPVVNQSAPIENAFQGLQIQNRFWSRLNALATDAEFSEQLRSEFSIDNFDDAEEGTEAEFSTGDLAPEFIEPQVDPFAEFEEYPQSYKEEARSTRSPAYETSSQAIDYQEAGGMFEDVIDDETVYTLLQDTTSSSLDDDFNTSDSLESDREPDFITPESNPETEPFFATQPFSEGESEPFFAVEPFPTEYETAFPALVEPVSINRYAQEIVVEDEPEVLTPETPAPEVSSAIVPQQVEAVVPLSSFEDIAVPTPELTVPTGELISGEPLTIWVKLPPHPTPIYVKLWVQDRQSRYLLDGPRSLMDFAPNEFDELETMAYLNVPFGSMEVRFEAIAVDIYTQKESHKVSVDRVVLPPDLPNFSLDEFEY